MSHLCPFLWRKALFLAIVLGCATVAPGCGDASGVGKTVPVTGKVTLDDKPLTAASTVILFKPDQARGNTSPFEPIGTVNDQGIYRLVTRGKKGAPPGWYKVIVTATESGSTEGKGKAKHRPMPRSLVPARYGLERTTPVAIEVVDSPAEGAYDVKLTSR
jgi:hypothetical protein